MYFVFYKAPNKRQVHKLGTQDIEGSVNMQLSPRNQSWNKFQADEWVLRVEDLRDQLFTLHMNDLGKGIKCRVSKLVVDAKIPGKACSDEDMDSIPG